VSSRSEIGHEGGLVRVGSEANGEPPAGTATPFAGYLLVEAVPALGKYELGTRRFPEGLWEAVKDVWEAGVVEEVHGHYARPRV
jgi:hypothetical protein